MNPHAIAAVAVLALSLPTLAEERVGLSLLFQNGQAAPIQLAGNPGSSPT